MFGLEKLCLIVLGYPNGMLFLCAIMGVGKINIKIIIEVIIFKYVW
jgi:hypothetical protein